MLSIFSDTYFEAKFYDTLIALVGLYSSNSMLLIMQERREELKSSSFSPDKKEAMLSVYDTLIRFGSGKDTNV